MKVHELPDRMRLDYLAISDHLHNLDHGYALEWLAWMIRDGHAPRTITIEWLEHEAEKSFRLAIEQYNYVEEDDDEAE